MMLIPPTLLLLYILYMAEGRTWIISAGFLAAGAVLYALLISKRVRGR